MSEVQFLSLGREKNETFAISLCSELMQVLLYHQPLLGFLLIQSVLVKRVLANLALNKSGNQCVSQVEVICDQTMCFGGVKLSLVWSGAVLLQNWSP